MDDKTINTAKISCILFIVVIVILVCSSVYRNGYNYTKTYIHRNIFDEEMLINIIINIGLISGFLGLFFFTYAAGVEADIVKINTKIVTDDLMETVSPLLNPNLKNKLSKKIIAPDLKAEDERVQQNNDELKVTAYTKLMIVVDIALTIAFILSVIYKHPFMKILGLNLIVLTFVGLTEFVFIHFIPHKFISADTHFVRYTILTKLHEKFIFPPSPTI
jgi:hypothetical protein